MAGLRERTGMKYWSPACRVDAYVLTLTLRQSDRTEMALMRDRVPSMPDLTEQLLGCVGRGCWSLWDGQDFLGLAGAEPIPREPGRGVIWFLGTIEVDERPLLLTKACIEMLEHYEKEFDSLGNCIPVEMEHRIRWLEMLGFDMEHENEHFLGQGLLAFVRKSQRPEH